MMTSSGIPTTGNTDSGTDGGSGSTGSSNNSNSSSNMVLHDSAAAAAAAAVVTSTVVTTTSTKTTDVLIPSSSTSASAVDTTTTTTTTTTTGTAPPRPPHHMTITKSSKTSSQSKPSELLPSSNTTTTATTTTSTSNRSNNSNDMIRSNNDVDSATMISTTVTAQSSTNNTNRSSSSSSSSSSGSCIQQYRRSTRTAFLNTIKSSSGSSGSRSTISTAAAAAAAGTTVDGSTFIKQQQQQPSSSSLSSFVSLSLPPVPTPPVQFPRRWPGIGTTFQCTKIPPLLDPTCATTTSTISTRPRPLLMSSEYPHCTEQELLTATNRTSTTSTRPSSSSSSLAALVNVHHVDDNVDDGTVHSTTTKGDDSYGIDIVDHYQRQPHSRKRPLPFQPQPQQQVVVELEDDSDIDNDNQESSTSQCRGTANKDKTSLIAQEWSRRLIAWYKEQRHLPQTNEGAFTTNDNTASMESSSSSLLLLNSSIISSITGTQQQPPPLPQRLARKRPSSAMLSTNEHETTDRTGSSRNTIQLLDNTIGGPLRVFHGIYNNDDDDDDDATTTITIDTDDILMNGQEQDAKTMLSYLAQWNYTHGRRSIKRQRRQLRREQEQQQRQLTVYTTTSIVNSTSTNMNTNHPNIIRNDSVTPPLVVSSTTATNHESNDTTAQQQQQQRTMPMDSLQTVTETNSNSGNDIYSNNNYIKKSDLATTTWCHKTLQDAIVTCSGDYRSYSTIRKYNTVLPPPSRQRLRHDETNNSATTVTTTEDILWQAVCAYVKELLQHLSKKSLPKQQRPIYLSDIWNVLCIITQLYQFDAEAAMKNGKEAESQQQLSDCMNELSQLYLGARFQYVHLLDLWGTEGIDVEMIDRHIDNIKLATGGGIVIDCIVAMQHQINVILQWQKKVDSAYQICNTTDNDIDRNDQLVLQQILDEGKLHGIRSKVFVALESKIERVNNLQDRIIRWRKSCNDSKETIKFTIALVRDIHRLKVRFPEGNEMLVFQQETESWVERANIAIRSRISLQEIKFLVDRGLEMPLDLNEYLEKLQSRTTMALEWIQSFENVISCPRRDGGQLDTELLIERIRSELDSKGGRCNSLNHLSLEGSRLPVEVDIAKILHIELDGRAWALKTKKFLPDVGAYNNDEIVEGNRKSKIEDLREHVVKAKVLHDRFALTAPEIQSWILDGETELLSIVEAADSWLSANRQIVDGDCDGPISIIELKQIVDSGNNIFANLGGGAAKLARFLQQVECWYIQYYPLFVRCGLRNENTHELCNQGAAVQLLDLKAAIDCCDVSIPFVEVAELQTLVDKVNSWRGRASQARATKNNLKRSQFLTIDDLTALIDESATYRVDTSTEVSDLQSLCDAIRDWQGRSIEELIKIAASFQYLRETLDDSFGPALEFHRGKMHAEVVTGGFDVKVSSDQHLILSSLSRRDGNVHVLVKSFSSSSNISSCIVTPESELALFLEEVLRWCVQSIQYLQNQHLVFDKKHFTSFDRFILDGKTLCSSEDMSDIVDELRIELTAVISNQLTRLDVLVSDRGGFLAWCKKANNVLHTEDRRPSLAKINELLRSSEEFPATCNVVQKVQSFANKGNEWVILANKAIAATGTEKLSIQDAKVLLDEGEAIGFICEELKILRNGIRAARGWSNRVKRAKVDEGGMEQDDLEALIKEHTSLIVDMTEEATQLQTTMKRYCLCRRAMYSFMIACDECNDWFHGPCVGITERRAVDRVAKYVCLRCSISKTYKSSALSCVNIIRKWVSNKEMKKFRQAENQKQKRKIRKETKDIEIYQAEILKLNELLKVRNDANTTTEESMEMQESALTCDVIDCERPQLNDSADGPSPTLGIVDSIDCVSGDQLTIYASTSDDVTSSVEVINEVPNSDIVAQFTVPNVDDEVIHEAPVEGSVEGSMSNYSHHKNLSKDGIISKVKHLEDVIQDARERLNELEVLATQQKVIDNEELKLSTQLRFWLIRVRSLVLVPRTCELALLSKPKSDGSISEAMEAVIKDAQLLGIHTTADVIAIGQAFQRMAWCILATSIFHREPSAIQVDTLVDMASRIEMSDEKSIRSIRLLAQRVSSWQSKVEKTLTPIPGETKPYSLDLLKFLHSAGGDIPVCIPIEQRLSNIIDDKGARYCLCGGPSDGRFMVSCDKCDRWFHGHCVNVQSTENDLKDWTCPPCSGQVIDIVDLDLDRFHDNFDVADEEDSDSDGIVISTNDKLWPPFGLFGSAEATEVLGEEVCKYQDCVNELVPDATMSVSVETSPMQITSTIPAVQAAAVATTSTTTLHNQHILVPSLSLSVIGYCGDSNILNPTPNVSTTTSGTSTTMTPSLLRADNQSSVVTVGFGFGSDGTVPQQPIVPPPPITTTVPPPPPFGPDIVAESSTATVSSEPLGYVDGSNTLDKRN